MKRAIAALALGLVVLGAVPFATSCGRSKNKADLEHEQERAEAQRVVRQLVARHNAVTGWLGTYRESNSVHGRPFTIELQDALVKTAGRPVLFFATLDDVGSREGSYYVRLRDWECWDMSIELSCTEETAREIVKDDGSWLADYAVIASVSEVRRPPFSVGVDPDDEGAQLRVAVDSVLVVDGTLVELARLECFPDWPGD